VNIEPALLFPLRSRCTFLSITDNASVSLRKMPPLEQCDLHNILGWFGGNQIQQSGHGDA
jgi:hypothetical protein